MRKFFLSFFVAVFFTMASASLATSVLNIEVETGAMKDQAKAVTKSAKGLISIADPLDAKFFFTAEPGSLVVYRDETGANFFIITGVGDSVVEMPAEWFDSGKYVAINTTEPDGCTTLTLDECRADAGFLNETSFLMP